ncbi:MAG: hypothetical protein RPS47_07765 [Colwellia sp.]
MDVKCLKCSYVMSTNQEVQSGVMKILGGILDFISIKKPPVQNLIAGALNSDDFGKPVPCPKCKSKGSWEDC